MPANYRDSLLRPVPWLESFDIDGDVMDVEHKWLIEAFNHACLQTAQSATLGRQAVADCDIIGLLATHFANEEELFDSLDYPDGALHRREHDHIRWLSTPLMATCDDHTFVRSLIQSRTFLVEHLIRHDLGFKTHLLHRDGK
ncbi:MAG: hemerythrin domain-containing protein [Magnetospirillum sp.]